MVTTDYVCVAMRYRDTEYLLVDVCVYQSYVLHIALMLRISPTVLKRLAQLYLLIFKLNVPSFK